MYRVEERCASKWLKIDLNSPLVKCLVKWSFRIKLQQTVLEFHLGIKTWHHVTGSSEASCQ